MKQKMILLILVMSLAVMFLSSLMGFLQMEGRSSICRRYIYCRQNKDTALAVSCSRRQYHMLSLWRVTPR